MRYYLDLVKISTRYEEVIAWYEIIITWYVIIITLYAILKRNNVMVITRNAIINFQRVILTRDESYFSRENLLISRDINLSWNFSRDIAICNKHGLLITWFGHSYPMVLTGCVHSGFSFIFEVDFKEMTAFVSILRSDLTSLMSLSPDQCV